MTLNSMQDHVAVVVGGSGAIGSAICRHFANAGAACVVTYNNGERPAKDLVANLPGSGHSASHIPVDDSAALNALAAQVQAKHGRLDVLVNCAGITRYVSHSDLDALDDQLIDDIFRVNWRGPFAAVRAFRNLLAAGGDGLVINISSIAGVQLEIFVVFRNASTALHIEKHIAILHPNIEANIPPATRH